MTAVLDPRLIWLRCERVGFCFLYRPPKGKALSASCPYPRVSAGQTVPGSTRHRTIYLHRWVWETIHGPIPQGLFVCHRCDTPACLNPNHLFLGTVQDNNADRIAKKRGGIGVYTEVAA